MKLVRCYQQCVASELVNNKRAGIKGVCSLPLTSNLSPLTHNKRVGIKGVCSLPLTSNLSPLT